MLGEESLTNVLAVDRLSLRRTRFVDGIGGELEELFGRKCVVPDVQRCEFGEDLSGIFPKGIPARAIPIASARSSGEGCRFGAIA